MSALSFSIASLFLNPILVSLDQALSTNPKPPPHILGLQNEIPRVLASVAAAFVHPHELLYAVT